MNQTLLFPDVLADRLAAIEADIGAAGGFQVVGHELGLSDDPETAGRILNNKLRQNGRHRLSDEETWRIKRLARKASGKSRLHELESDELAFEGKWLTTEDIKARRRKRKAALLAELLQLEQEDE